MAPGETRGAYTLLEPIGRGGMGEVWRAVHRTTGLVAAIKLVSPSSLDGPEHAARLVSEVAAIARLSHPGVVAVLDAGLAETPWLAMELVDGGTLQALEGAQSWERARRILDQMLDALAWVHARGVVHGDLKPSNVLIRRGADVPVLADFGLADARPGSALLGSPRWLAPERFAGAPPSVAGDLYALGCLAWSLVAGAPPFSGDLAALQEAHSRWPPPPLRPMYAVPADLEVWLGALLEKAPEDRPACAADAHEMLGALGPAATVSAPATRAGIDDGETLPLGALAPARKTPLKGRLPLRRAPVDRVERLLAPSPQPPPLAPGAGLLGLRTAPLVGRSTEKAILAQIFEEVATLRRPRMVVLVGPSGSGRRRLARWLGERASELGLAWVRDAAPAGSAAWREILGWAESLDRPGLVLLPPTSADLLAPAVAMLKRRRKPLALLVVAVAAETTAAPGATRIELPRLDVGDLAATIQRTLRTAPEVADRVAARADGLPGQAMALLTAWVGTGLLEVGPDGALRAAAAPDGASNPVDSDLDLAAVDTLIAQGAYGSATVLLDSPGTATPTAELLLRRARVARSRQDLHGARALLDQIAESGALAAQVVLERGWISLYCGQLSEAEAAARRAHETALVLGDATCAAAAQGLRANTLLRQSDLVAAARAYAETGEAFAALGRDAEEAAARLGQGLCALLRGDDAAAGQLLRQALAGATRARADATAADITNALGELYRRTGAFNAAAAHFQAALSSHEARGSSRALHPRLNLAIVDLERGRADIAAAHLDGVLLAATANGERALLAEAHLARAWCGALAARWSDAARDLSEATAALATTGVRDPSVLVLVQRVREVVASSSGPEVEELRAALTAITEEA